MHFYYQKYPKPLKSPKRRERSHESFSLSLTSLLLLRKPLAGISYLTCLHSRGRTSILQKLPHEPAPGADKGRGCSQSPWMIQKPVVDLEGQRGSHTPWMIPKLMDHPKAQGCSQSPRIIPKLKDAPSPQGCLYSPEGSPAVPSHPEVPRTTKGPLSHPLQVALSFSPLYFFPLRSSLKKTTDFPACLLVLY